MTFVRTLVYSAAAGALFGLVSCAFAPAGRPDRFALVSCRPEAGVCLTFDSATGTLFFTPLPQLAPPPQGATKGSVLA